MGPLETGLFTDTHTNECMCNWWNLNKLCGSHCLKTIFRKKKNHDSYTNTKRNTYWRIDWTHILGENQTNVITGSKEKSRSTDLYWVRYWVANRGFKSTGTLKDKAEFAYWQCWILAEPCVPRKHQRLRNLPNPYLSEIPPPFCVLKVTTLSRDSHRPYSGLPCLLVTRPNTLFPFCLNPPAKARHRSSNSLFFVTWTINWD